MWSVTASAAAQRGWRRLGGPFTIWWRDYARTHLRLKPEDIGEVTIGHFAFFHSRFQSSLWPIVLAWLLNGELMADTPGRVITLRG